MKDESLYMKTPSTTDFMLYYDPISMPIPDDTNQIIVVDKKYHHKPGLLAYDLYGNERLSWVIRYFNNEIIEDPIFDLEEGITIVVPSKNRLMQYI